MTEKKVTRTKRALLFTAHPDDHLICAGTLMLLKDRGLEVVEIVATGGENGTWWSEDGKKKVNFDKSELEKTRKEEISQASKLIGIDKTHFLGLVDGSVKSDSRIVEKVMRIIRKERPQIVITHNTNDYHPDHVEVSKIVTEAAQRASWTYLPEAGESFKTPMLLYGEGFYFGKNDITFDITKHLDRKNRLLDIYRSQIFPSERRLLQSMNSYHAFFLRDEKVLAAESFEIPEKFPVNMDVFMFDSEVG